MNADPTPSSEVQRLTAEYRERDEGGVASAMYSFANPGYTFHVHDLEWQLLRELRRHDVDLGNSSVLEVGSGFGNWLQRFKEFGAREAVGVEVLPWRVEAGRERYPAIEQIAGDAAELPFPDGRFQVVVQLTCLSSVLDEDVRRRIAAEMWRVLAPGGIVLSYDMRATPLAIRALGRVYTMLHGSGDSGTTTIPIAAKEIANLFGCPITSRRIVTLNFELASIAGRSHLAATLLARLPWLKTHEIVVIRKP
jgi:ubiquinone/menaquinone biosynthesis C-methylase UbiE